MEVIKIDNVSALLDCTSSSLLLSWQGPLHHCTTMSMTDNTPSKFSEGMVRGCL